MQPVAGVDQPRFRQDLLAEPVDEHGATFIDVMDPDSGNVFRFYEVEFSLACAMDGERDVPGLVRWAQDELGLTPNPSEVRDVIATLGELGYLDHTAEARAAAASVEPVAAETQHEDAVEEVVSEDRTMPVPPRAAAATISDAVPSEVSVNLSDHVEVGPADVQEAVRQSRVMTAVEPPLDEFDDSLAMPAELGPLLPPRVVERPVEAKPAPKPTIVAKPAVAAKLPETPTRRAVVSRHEAPTVEQPPLERPLELVERAAAADRAVERATERAADRAADRSADRAIDRPTVRERPAEKAERPAALIVETPVPPVAAKPAGKPERAAELRKPVEIPKEPPKVAEPLAVAPTSERRISPALIVLIVIVVLGVAAFLVWRYLLSASSPNPTEAAAAEKIAPPTPPPAPPEPASATSKIELASGKPKTILALFPGTIEWIEASDKDVKPSDVIVKLRGAKPLEAQVAALTKELEKRKQELDAAVQARDAAETDAAKERAAAKVTTLEKVYGERNEALTKKIDQLEPFLVRPPIEGKLTVTSKVGTQIPENTPVATVLSPPVPSATFKLPEGVGQEVGVEVALNQGKKVLTCTVAEFEPGSIRMTCPPETGAEVGAEVKWILPQI